MDTLPSYQLRTKYAEDKPWIWCELRKKWLIWQPEEAVRQQLLLFLLKEKEVPVGLIAVEREIAYHGQKKRFDVVVFDRQGLPNILCECKAPQVELTQATIDQACRYNQILGAPHFLLFNGRSWYFFSQVKNQGFHYQPSGWL